MNSVFKDMRYKLKIGINLLVLIISIACNRQSKSVESDLKSESKVTVEKFTTLTGKVYVVEIDHSAGASICDITISPKAFTAANSIHRIENADPIKDIFLADLDKNGFEEIYIITVSAGSGSYASIYGLASNKDKSATPVYVRPISEKQKEKGALFEGFMGHNTFTVEDGKLFESFPVYKEGDNNSKATGGTRVVEYQLIAGEAGWILEPK